jgi:membrane protein implicated in regulation of membrane protease activity
VIRTENKGLSSARNTGWQAATGEIVAYIDDDAWPDPHWLRCLAATFLSSDVVGVGGPNLPPPGDGPIAQAVARAPGGPTHVLLSDQIAEHIPGCNMAFRRDALRDLGGFDPQFRAAGDDVDLCWRLQARGWRLGFSPAALVWHHRRNSIRAYWRQQRNYGKAEALLEMKWPEKYNPVGHVTWEGRLYGNGLTRALMWRSQRIYHGVWGTGLFQSLYDRRPGLLNSLPLMPEWYLVIAGLAALSFLGLLWAPLLIAAPLLALACAAVLVQAIDSVTHASSVSQPSGNRPSLKVASLTLLLHLLQPLARLLGRVRYGLTPWRRRCQPCFAFPRPRTMSIWSEHWKPPERHLEAIESVMKGDGSVLRRGGEFDRWDLEIRGGLFGGLRLLAAVEEHGAGKQLVRIRTWPKFATVALILTTLSSLLAVLAAMTDAWVVAALLAAAASGLAASAFADCAAAQAAGEGAISAIGAKPDQPAKGLGTVENARAAIDAPPQLEPGRR